MDDERTIESIICEAERLCRKLVPVPVGVVCRDLPNAFGAATFDYDLMAGIILLDQNLIHVSDKQITDTILHEIAHVLVLSRRLPGPPHGLQWRKIARHIGAKPRARCKDWPQTDLRFTPAAMRYWLSVCNPQMSKEDINTVINNLARNQLLRRGFSEKTIAKMDELRERGYTTWQQMKSMLPQSELPSL
jgi:hypothetical protein